MSQKALERLEILRQLNGNKEWINHGLYRLMFEEDLYQVAYERIKSKSGNMTAGTDGKTLDGFSQQEIQTIIQLLRTEQFHFKPVKTTFIPKANGKLRKLGIPSTRDKVVQEVIHLILEAIYDSPYGAYFRPTSHGFRPQRSCHSALKEIREKCPLTGSERPWIYQDQIAPLRRRLADRRQWELCGSFGNQTGDQNLPERSSQAHAERREDEDHPCENRRSLFPRNQHSYGRG
jgi:Reverse transcriptase (RNA-dependent DNA polymerase)